MARTSDVVGQRHIEKISDRREVGCAKTAVRIKAYYIVLPPIFPLPAIIRHRAPYECIGRIIILATRKAVVRYQVQTFLYHESISTGEHYRKIFTI